MTAVSPSERGSRVKRILESFGVSALVAMIVSGLVGSYFAVKLENGKERVAAVVRYNQSFESAQNNVFMQIGLYSGKLLDQRDDASQDALLSAIVATQLEVNNLRMKVDEPAQIALSEYSAELSNLSNALRNVSSASHLGPVYASAQRLLELHDQVASGVQKNLEIKFFAS